MGAAMWGKFDEVVHTMFIKTVNDRISERDVARFLDMVEEKGANLDNFKDYNREKIKSGVAGGFGGFQCCQKRRPPTTDNKNEREGEFVAKTYDVPTLKQYIVDRQVNMNRVLEKVRDWAETTQKTKVVGEILRLYDKFSLAEKTDTIFLTKLLVVMCKDAKERQRSIIKGILAKFPSIKQRPLGKYGFEVKRGEISEYLMGWRLPELNAAVDGMRKHHSDLKFASQKMAVDVSQDTFAIEVQRVKDMAR